tara:strand:+ start:834 stop:1574 length:741 start_codon:yes stop_codon:yes gene_type:complete
MLKNNHLKMNIHNQTKTIFLKFCYFSLAILLFSCKADTPKKEKQSEINNNNSIEIEKTEKNTTKKIIFFGDSLTAGYGLDDVENAFPGIIQRNIDSLQLNYTVVNSGVSGETSSGGKNRIDWVLNEKPAVFVLELGANDGLRGVPLTATKRNLQFIIDAVKTKYPTTKIVLAGMQIPPNMGQAYAAEFKSIFPDLAQKNEIVLVPFLLENVGGIAGLNQSDGIHPTKEGHAILANNVWTILAPLLY